MKLSDQREVILQALTLAVDSCLEQAEEHGKSELSGMEASITLSVPGGGLQICSSPVIDFNKDSTLQLQRAARIVDE